MFTPRLLAAFALSLACGACASQDPSPGPTPTRPDLVAEAAGRGQRLAAAACASCHAIDQGGASPMAAATPFREIVGRYPLSHLEEAFAEGLVTSHPAMPAYVFRASEIDDLIAYLETVRAGP